MHDVTAAYIQYVVGGNAASGLTISRIALYTVAANGSMTLVARTANNTAIGTSTNSLNQAALDTARGYPASYTYIPGQRYAIAVTQVGTTVGEVFAAQNDVAVSNQSPVTVSSLWSGSDLATSYAAGSLSAGWWNTPWLTGLA